jgi:N-acetylmuramoyl-L-alanine amidase
MRDTTDKRVRVLGICMAFSFLLFFHSLSYAGAEVEITGIRCWSYPDYTRVVIDLSGSAEFTENRLTAPERLFFDISNGRVGGDLQKDISIGNGMLESIRSGQRDENTARVVLDLGNVQDFKVFTLEDPIRIVVDLYGSAAVSARKRIVIDPGHGGHDPGAVGPKNLYEKNVVLDIALRLRKILSGDPNLEVFMTRDKDVFVPLEERTAIANSKNADLFVSIHANASRKRETKGIETYFLNWTNDEEALKVAARENQISLKQMRNMQDKRNVLDIMLGDLSRDLKREKSLRLANYIQKNMVNELNKDYNHIVDLGVKQALFYVLLGARMSSVLVEVSFISNPVEEKLLAGDNYRDDLARSIASGINQYMTSPFETQTLANIRNSVDHRD